MSIVMACAAAGNAHIRWHHVMAGRPATHAGCRTRESFKGLGSYYKLAVPSTLMVCLEWWACECLLLHCWAADWGSL